MNKNIKNKLTGLVSASRALRTLVVAALCMTGTFVSAQETTGETETETNVLWSEDWTGGKEGLSVSDYSPKNGGTYTIEGTSGKTMIRGGSPLAGGEAPELQLGADDVFKVTLTQEELGNYSGKAKLTFKSNRSSYKVTAYGTDITSNPVAGAYSVTFDIVSGKDLVLTVSSAQQGRLDDFELTKTTASDKKNVTIKVDGIKVNGSVYKVYDQENNQPFATFSISEEGVNGKFSVDDNDYVTLDDNGNMTLTGKPGQTMVTVRWISNDETYADAAISFTLYVSKPVALSETDTELPAQCDMARITLTRTFNADAWNTLCLPFDMAASRVNGVFGADCVLLEFSSCAGNKVTFTKVNNGVKAGIPYLLKPTSVNEENVYTIPTTPILATEARTVGAEGGVRFCGTYIKKDITENGTVNAAGITADNKIVKANQGGEMKGFRAYFVLPEGTSAASYMLDLDGTVTSIDRVNFNGEVNIYAPVYNLNGQRVNGGNLQRGIYIQNGKKFVVK